MAAEKYILWNAGICPILLKVRHVTLATHPLGSFIIPYIAGLLAVAYPTKKKRSACNYHPLKRYGGRGPKI